jgi:hypothetical protein
MCEPVRPSPSPGTGLRLVHSVIAHSLSFIFDIWVMRALAEAVLPIPVGEVLLQHRAITAARVKAALQAGEPEWAEKESPERQS